MPRLRQVTRAEATPEVLEMYDRLDENARCTTIKLTDYGTRKVCRQECLAFMISHRRGGDCGYSRGIPGRDDCRRRRGIRTNIPQGHCIDGAMHYWPGHTKQISNFFFVIVIIIVIIAIAFPGAAAWTLPGWPRRTIVCVE